jgi:predicted enzyme related to lactoylglutathione lyase
MGRAVHFEIQASDPQALIDYYGGLFGWSFNKWEGGEYWLIDTGDAAKPGINGGLLPRRGPAPEGMAAVNAFVVTVDVDDIDAALAKAVVGGGGGGGGAVVCVPKMAVKGVGWLGYVKDPDGNIFGMMQADAKAA